MNHAHPSQPRQIGRFGLLVGVIAALLQWTGWLVLPALAPQWTIVGLLSAAVFGVLIGVWWLVFSLVPWRERLGAVVLIGVGLPLTARLAHPSIANGMMGMMPFVYAVPALSLALVASVVIGRGRSAAVRRSALVMLLLMACGSLLLIRTDGVRGDGDSDVHWRWTETAEARLLAETRDTTTPTSRPEGAATVERPREPVTPTTPEHPESLPSPAVAVTPTEGRSAADLPATTSPDTPPPEWPGFRGPARDGAVRGGVRIATDWSTSPPAQLWRRAVGPGWSSFAVRGDRLYTQEQRGEDEMVACYRVSTGEPIWSHRDQVRFWESNAGAGPRATPTVSGDRVYTLGATGIVNALDAGQGTVLWTRNAATDAGKEIPEWGVASSPLVVDDVVIVAVAGQLVAYDARSGQVRWTGQAGGGGYSSPHLVTLDGVEQVLILRGARTISVSPKDGTVLWDHTTGQPAVSIVQPAIVDNRDVLLAAGDSMGGSGIRRLAVQRGPEGWQVEERWVSRGLKPYFNDFVVHRGHAYGFDGSILASIDLTTGTRTWKGGRYGHGQLILLPDDDLLLVLSEDGELALVGATPNGYQEHARVPALEGKTWNHPALVGDVLLVRNGAEMAAFRLPRPR